MSLGCKLHLLMNDESSNTPKNETFRWLEPGAWRNEYYPEVVEKLREAGHDVYDFRDPPSGDPGFKWSSKR